MRAGTLLALALGLAACGGESDGARVRSVASDWLEAVYASDGERACELFAPDVVAGLPDCATTYSMLGEALGETLGGDAALRADELAATVDGDRAVVAVGGKGTLELVRVDGEWRVLRGFRTQ